MCTDFIISAKDGAFINGRTMEFAEDLRSNIFFRKAGYRFLNENRPSRAQFIWTGKYSYVGVNALGLDCVSDGINTEGLSGGALWLPESEYPESTNPANTISNLDFLQWLLSSFSSCNEVVLAMGKIVDEESPLNTFFEYKDSIYFQPQVQVTPISYQELDRSGPSGIYPIHFPLHDKTGHSIVIEFINGKVRIYNNPVHTCTNSPEFPFHMNNLRNYVNLQKENVKSATLQGYDFTSTGNGSGLKGLPGDPTPPSRFIKTAFTSGFVNQGKDSNEALNIGFHIMNTVDIPKGLVVEPQNEGAGEDYTQWVASKDLTNGVFCIRFYELSQVTAITLNDVDWDEKDGKCYRPEAISPYNIKLTEVSR
ncbi:Choloylglycine hydrolase [Marinomonas spartinae]|uniref:Choloylglycine hydrolase n=1 Tax=Marinomonas spartinae TaxID=1792290 RepID=A0A1A8T2N9_9GAMM|nr:linear amide C-N hydrolase [Marinomonas spartinae]SBS25612.1 Choloylglycine hydrolase [Marinomonas spartinae]